MPPYGLRSRSKRAATSAAQGREEAPPAKIQKKAKAKGKNASHATKGAQAKESEAQPAALPNVTKQVTPLRQEIEAESSNQNLASASNSNDEQTASGPKNVGDDIVPVSNSDNKFSDDEQSSLSSGGSANDDDDFVPDFAIDADDEPEPEIESDPYQSADLDYEEDLDDDLVNSDSVEDGSLKRRRARSSAAGSSKYRTPARPKSKKKARKAVRKDKKRAASTNVRTVADAAAVAKLFEAFDEHGNGRFSMRDLQRVADDHGQFHTADELRDMIRFWDASGTGTIALSSFRSLASDCGFIASV